MALQHWRGETGSVYLENLVVVIKFVEAGAEIVAGRDWSESIAFQMEA
jgi:hypothetical protein